MCSATNLLSTEHTHCSGEENTAILSHPSVILSLYPSFSTPALFASALLSSSLLFPSLCYPPLPLSLSFIPHHSLFSIMSVPTGHFLSFSVSLFPTLSSLFHLALRIFLSYLTFFFFPFLNPLSLAVLARLLTRHLFPSPSLIRY